MEKEIIVIFQPFTIEQKILVMTGGDCIYETSAHISEVEDAIKQVAAKYNCSIVKLHGGKGYLSKIMDSLSNNTNLDINII